MKKEIGAYKMYLLVSIICNVLLVVLNISILISNGFSSLVYFIAVLLVSGVNGYCFIKSEKNLGLSVRISIFSGSATAFLALLDGFKLFTSNLRILGWGPIIFGISLVIKAMKINKHLKIGG